MKNFITAVAKRLAKPAIQILPFHEVIIQILPGWVAFQKVWPLIDSISGLLVSPYQEQWLFQAARSLPDKAVVLEIGSYKGRSTACLAFGCIGTRKHAYVVDTFNGNDIDFFDKDFFEEFRCNIERCGLKPYITPLIGYSSVIAKDWTKPIHLLFIDGSHRFEDVLADFDSFFPYVVPGGLVAVHDVVEEWPGSLKAWHGHIKQRLVNIGQCITLSYGTKPI